jgi:hypothetical protein
LDSSRVAYTYEVLTLGGPRGVASGPPRSAPCGPGFRALRCGWLPGCRRAIYKSDLLYVEGSCTCARRLGLPLRRLYLRGPRPPGPAPGRCALADLLGFRALHSQGSVPSAGLWAATGFWPWPTPGPRPAGTRTSRSTYCTWRSSRWTCRTLRPPGSSVVGHVVILYNADTFDDSGASGDQLSEAVFAPPGVGHRCGGRARGSGRASRHQTV